MSPRLPLSPPAVPGTGGGAAARGFLLRVARHVALDLLRRNRAAPSEEASECDDLPLPDAATDDAAADRSERVRLLAGAIATLPAREREVFVLHRVRGFAPPEAAALLGLSERAVGLRADRAMKRCAGFLRRRGGGLFDDEADCPASRAVGSPGAAGLPALDWVRCAGAEDELVADVRRLVRRRRARRLAAAAAGCVVLLLFAMVAWRGDPVVPGSVTTAVSGPEWRSLPDGSAAELKPGADLAYEERGTTRRVVLRRGEAHFQVRKDGRAFVVEASGVQIRAVGTAFAVSLGAQKVEIVVTEGRVQVVPERAAADAESGAAGGPELRAGHRAFVTRGEGGVRVETLDSAGIATRLAWRVPNLAFSRTPLGEVVELMNRHGTDRTGVFFALGDPELHDVVLSGSLRADDVEGLVRLIETRFGLRVERSEDTITLRRAP